MATKNRTELKSYFVKNAIPTQANFADLIDASLNQVDDGLLKLPDEPWTLVSVGGSQQRVLRLFGSYPAANPDWMVSLNPGPDPAQAGLGISDGATGALRLFVSKANGRVGIGTNAPQAALDVTGDARVSGPLTIQGGATVGSLTVQANARVAGALTVAGARIYNSANFAVAQMDQTDWLRINPDSQFDGTALYKSLALGTGGLAIGTWDKLPAGQLSVTGRATLPGGISVQGAVPHIEADGAFYRNTDGQVYITVDDLLYIRDQGAAAGVWAARFETDGGHLRLAGDLSARNVYSAGGYLVLAGGREGVRGDDTWLRLNQAGAFASGTHTPGLFAPMSINVAAAGGSWELNPGQGCIYAAGNIGSANWSPTGGGNYPAGWGGGVHTWDLVAEGSVGYAFIRQWSSVREKTNIQPLRDALAIVEQLNPARFEKAGEERIGFIAEEVLEVFKLAAAGSDDFFASGIAPDALLALAVAAVQELSLKVRALESRAEKRVRPTTKGEESVRIVREGEHDGQRYVTARFQADHGRQVVRTLRIPANANRDDTVRAEHAAWLQGLARETTGVD